MKSQNLFLGLRLAATLLTFVLLFGFYDFHDVADQIAAVGLLSFLVGAVLLALCTAGMAWKWKLALHDAHYTVLLRALVSSYFYTILPSGQLGGEVSKILLVKSKQPEVHHIVGSVLFDKITGLLGLVIVGSIALALSPSAKHAWQVVIVASITACCLGILWSSTHLAPVLNGITVEQPILTRAKSVLQSIIHRIGCYAGNRQLVVGSVFLGVLTQGTVVAIYLVLATALNIVIAPTDLIAAVVLANLAALIPISIAGLGVREAGLTILLAQYPGVTSGQALALSLSAMGVLLLGALAGALIELRVLLVVGRRS